MTEDIYLGLKIESDLLSEDICTASTKFNPCNKSKDCYCQSKEILYCNKRNNEEK